MIETLARENIFSAFFSVFGHHLTEVLNIWDFFHRKNQNVLLLFWNVKVFFENFYQELNFNYLVKHFTIVFYLLLLFPISFQVYMHVLQEHRVVFVFLSTSVNKLVITLRLVA